VRQQELVLKDHSGVGGARDDIDNIRGIHLWLKQKKNLETNLSDMAKEKIGQRG
jgi:hypothetical protein